MEIGKANYGGQKKDSKIEDGDNIYRIIPPLGSAAAKGIWNVYLALEWGYKNELGKHKPFQDCRKVNFQTKMVEVESPAYLKRMKLEENKKAIVAAFKEGKATKDQVQEAVDLCKQFNLGKKYYLNVVNLKGEISRLPIGYKAMQGVKECIKELSKKGVDPLSVDNGRYFNIFRSGRGLDTMYKVTIYQEEIQATVNGKQMTVAQEKVHAMDEAFIGRLGSEACDLLKFKDGYPCITPDEIQQMIDGGSKAVDEVFAKYSKKEEPKQEVKQEPKQEAAPKAEVAIEQRAEAVVDKIQEEVLIKQTPVEEVKTVQAEAISPEPKQEVVTSKAEELDAFLAGLQLD